VAALEMSDEIFATVSARFIFFAHVTTHLNH